MITIVRYRPPSKSHTVPSVVGAGVGAGIGSGLVGPGAGEPPGRPCRPRRRRCRRVPRRLIGLKPGVPARPRRRRRSRRPRTRLAAVARAAIHHANGDRAAAQAQLDARSEQRRKPRGAERAARGASSSTTRRSVQHVGPRFVVGDVQIEIAIAVVVGPRDTGPPRGVADPGRRGGVDEGAVALIRYSHVGSAVVGKVEIEVAVAVVIGPRDAAPQKELETPTPAGRGGVDEGAVALVPVQHVGSDSVGEVEIEVAVAVVVGPRAARPIPCRRRRRSRSRR